MGDIKPAFGSLLGDPGPGGAEQYDLLGLTRPASAPGGPGPVSAERLRANAGRPGRPLGSRNKRTQEWQDFILSRYGSPLEGLAQLGMAMTVDDIVAATGCKPIEALDLKRKAMSDLAPYVHQRQPLAVTVEGRQTVALVIGELPDGQDMGGQAEEGEFLEIEEIQQLSTPRPDGD